VEERTDDIAKRLSEKGPETLAFFRALTPDQWRQQVYTTGPQWDARQVLCHFVSAERAFSAIFEAALRGDTTAPESFDIDAFNAREVGAMDGLAPADLLARFEQTRARTLAFVQRLDDADLDREAWHPWFGWDKLEKFLKLVYRHNLIHERDVRKALETGTPIAPAEGV
jgi:uncharacterized protein (TIGR03083 family)